MDGSGSGRGSNASRSQIAVRHSRVVRPVIFRVASRSGGRPRAAEIVERRRALGSRRVDRAMARRATIQRKVHRPIVEGMPSDDADIECLIQGLRLVTPCTQPIDRLIDLLEQIRGGGQPGRVGPG